MRLSALGGGQPSPSDPKDSREGFCFADLRFGFPGVTLSVSDCFSLPVIASVGGFVEASWYESLCWGSGFGGD